MTDRLTTAALATTAVEIDPPVEIVAGTTLHHDGSTWVIASPSGAESRRYGTGEVRISISSTAYCSDSTAAAAELESACDALTIAEIERRPFEDLCDRGLIGSDEPPHLGDIVGQLLDTCQRCLVLS